MRSLAAATFLVAMITACPRVIDDNSNPDPNSGPDAGPDGDPLICVDNDECAPGICLNGLCSAAECATKATCSSTEICTQGQCSPPPAACSDSNDCPGTEVCDGFSARCFDPDNPSEGEGEPAEGEGEGEGEGELDLSGFRIENREDSPATQAGDLPDGTSMSAGDVLVIGRDASRNEFEAYWGALPAGTLYINAQAEDLDVPIVNGAEKWVLLDDNGNVVDGPTIVGGQSKSYQRTNAGNANNDNNWAEVAEGLATPGAVDLPNSNVDLVISEWSDGDGEFEFIELYFAP